MTLAMGVNYFYFNILMELHVCSEEMKDALTPEGKPSDLNSRYIYQGGVKS